MPMWNLASPWHCRHGYSLGLSILIPQGLPDDHFKPATLSAPVAGPPKVAAVNADGADELGSRTSGERMLAATSGLLPGVGGLFRCQPASERGDLAPD